MRRVVVTGMGGLSPMGCDWPSVFKTFKQRQSCIVSMPEWDIYKTLRVRLGAPLPDFKTPSHYTRKQKRSMGRVALLAVRASELALENAGLLNSPKLNDGSVGVAYGSSSGSSDAMYPIARFLMGESNARVEPTTYLKMMSHTCAANISLFFKLTGRIIPTPSACTSGSQGIGYGYESIKSGKSSVMIVGGAEELHLTQVLIFDRLFAASTRNNEPELTPRPFDKDRDGLVLGEGAATLILEDLEHAKARNATIYAELVGFGTNSDGTHITRPNADGMARAMELSLEDAQLRAESIGYVNAHATATEWGDIAESQATAKVFGDKVPVSSFKGYMGHSLGASGAIEAWLSIEMMRHNWYVPTLHLETVDPRCAPLNYIKKEARYSKVNYVMSNNFSFLGINTSLIFKRWLD